MCQTYIRLLQLILAQFSLIPRALLSISGPCRMGGSNQYSAATTWIGWAAGNTNSQSGIQPLVRQSFLFQQSSYFYLQTFVFLIDEGTVVCYNIFSATILGRRLVLPIEDCDLWSQRNLLAEILTKGGLVLCWQLSCLFRSLACVLHALRLDTQ